MTLEALLAAIDTLTWEELKQVQRRIDQRQQGTAEERISMIEAAVAGIREGLTQAELDAIFAAMNAKIATQADDGDFNALPIPRENWRTP